MSDTPAASPSAARSGAPRPRVAPTGRERTFAEHEFVVSKTDLTGKITYVNDVFLRITSFTREALHGSAHSIVRHPGMPRGIFSYLWAELKAGREVYAYIVNLAANGDHYWVFAHVTPTHDHTGRLVGYHSNRRPVERRALAGIEPLYAEMCRLEAQAGDKRLGIEASLAHLQRVLAARGQSYDEFVWSI